MRVSFVAGFAALALAGVACRSGQPGGAGMNAQGGLVVADAGTDPLRLELILPPRVRQGQPVPLRLRAQNVSGRAFDLYLRGRTITFDVIIARAAGEVVWRRLEGEIIPAIIQLHPLAPGEQIEVEAEWDQRTKDRKRVEPGEYVATGLLLVEGDPLRTPPTPLTIEKIR
jgi:hypothetical protein